MEPLSASMRLGVRGQMNIQMEMSPVRSPGSTQTELLSFSVTTVIAATVDGKGSEHTPTLLCISDDRGGLRGGCDDNEDRIRVW